MDSRRRRAAVRERARRSRLHAITERIDAGRLSVEVGEVLLLAEARLAHWMLEGAPHRRGKIVLRAGAS